MTIPHNTFKQYYNSLNLDDKQSISDQIRAALDISESTFYRRINAPWLFNPAEREKIAQLTGISEHLLFSPETLNQPA